MSSAAEHVDQELRAMRRLTLAVAGTFDGTMVETHPQPDAVSGATVANAAGKPVIPVRSRGIFRGCLEIFPKASCPC